MYKNNSGLIAKTKVSKYKKGLCLTEKLVLKNPLLFLYVTVAHNMRKSLPIEKVKTEFINSCMNYNAKSFIPFLLSENVKTGMPNKIRFYGFWKGMLSYTKENSKGRLTAKIEHLKNENNSIKYYLNFYDKIHLHSRLTIEVIEDKEYIYLDTLPF